MKFAIVVCILVVLAVHEAVSYRKRVSTLVTFPALVEGNCKAEDLPPSILNTCSRVTCRKLATGRIGYSAVPCGLYVCKNGNEFGHGPYDLTKPYPKCCNYGTCD